MSRSRRTIQCPISEAPCSDPECSITCCRGRERQRDAYLREEAYRAGRAREDANDRREAALRALREFVAEMSTERGQHIPIPRKEREDLIAEILASERQAGRVRRHLAAISDERARKVLFVATLGPITTGLPMIVWVASRGASRYGPWPFIRVEATHGSQSSIANTAVVAVGPKPLVLSGRLSLADKQAVFEWVSRNLDALVAHWLRQVDSAQLVHMLKPRSNT
jgi:hypothetical protein